jgi:hypothetical protein
MEITILFFLFCIICNASNFKSAKYAYSADFWSCFAYSTYSTMNLLSVFLARVVHFLLPILHIVLHNLHIVSHILHIYLFIFTENQGESPFARWCATGYLFLWYCGTTACSLQSQPFIRQIMLSQVCSAAHSKSAPKQFLISLDPEHKRIGECMYMTRIFCIYFYIFCILISGLHII